MEDSDSDFLYPAATQDLPIPLVCGIYPGRTHVQRKGSKGELS